MSYNEYNSDYISPERTLGPTATNAGRTAPVSSHSYFREFYFVHDKPTSKKKAREAVIKPPHEPSLIIAEANVQFKSLGCAITTY